MSDLPNQQVMANVRKVFWSNRLVWIALAGAIVVAGVVLIIVSPSRESNDPLVALVAPRDGSTLVLLHRFTWRQTSPPSVYHFFLYEVNRTPVWSTLVKDTSLILPTTVPLQRGRTYLWRVEAILPDEKTIHSDLRSFTLSQ